MELTKKRFYLLSVSFLFIIGMIYVIAPSVSHPYTEILGAVNADTIDGWHWNDPAVGYGGDPNAPSGDIKDYINSLACVSTGKLCNTASQVCTTGGGTQVCDGTNPACNSCCPSCPSGSSYCGSYTSWSGSQCVGSNPAPPGCGVGAASSHGTSASPDFCDNDHDGLIDEPHEFTTYSWPQVLYNGYWNKLAWSGGSNLAYATLTQQIGLPVEPTQNGPAGDVYYGFVGHQVDFNVISFGTLDKWCSLFGGGRLKDFRIDNGDCNCAGSAGGPACGPRCVVWWEAIPQWVETISVYSTNFPVISSISCYSASPSHLD